MLAISRISCLSPHGTELCSKWFFIGTKQLGEKGATQPPNAPEQQMNSRGRFIPFLVLRVIARSMIRQEHGFGVEETIANYYKRIDPPDCFVLRKRLRREGREG